MDNLLLCEIFAMGMLVCQGKEKISSPEYASLYAKALAGERLPSVALSKDSSSMAKTVVGDKAVFRPILPVVQIQPLKVGYSAIDGKFRTMVFGPDAFFWGVQISYPQIFTDGTGMVYQTLDEKKFPDASIFRACQKWVRRNSVPTTFLVEGRRVRVPIRIGKKCISWVNNFEPLKRQKIEVVE